MHRLAAALLLVAVAGAGPAAAEPTARSIAAAAAGRGADFILPGVGVPVGAALGGSGGSFLGYLEPRRFVARDGRLALVGRLEGWLRSDGRRPRNVRVRTFPFDTAVRIVEARCDAIVMELEAPRLPRRRQLAHPLVLVLNGRQGGLDDDGRCAVAAAVTGGAAVGEVVRLLNNEPESPPIGEVRACDAIEKATCISTGVLCTFPCGFGFDTNAPACLACWDGLGEMKGYLLFCDACL